MKNERFIAQGNVRNFRDFGGWETDDSTQIVTQRLFRSGHWGDAKPNDLQRLMEIGVDIVVDLRRPAERVRQPNAIPINLSIQSWHSAGGDMSDPPHLMFLRGGNLTRSSVRLYMQGAYRRIPVEEHHQQLFRKTILALGQGKTVLIHCAAGKDRTGILAALILQLIGVPQQLVMEDYLLTNQAVNIEQLLPQIARQISEQLEQDIEPDVLYPMLGVEPGFLAEAQKIMGDPRQYALQQLGLSAGDLTRLKTSLTA